MLSENSETIFFSNLKFSCRCLHQQQSIKQSLRIGTQKKLNKRAKKCHANTQFMGISCHISKSKEDKISATEIIGFRLYCKMSNKQNRSYQHPLHKMKKKRMIDLF